MTWFRCIKGNANKRNSVDLRQGSRIPLGKRESRIKNGKEQDGTLEVMP